MTLSRRTILAVGGTLLILLAGIYVIASRVMLHGFRNVESISTRLHVERAVNTLDAVSEQLSVKLADWGSWDDCYRFVVDQTDEFAESNLQPTSLKSLGLRFILFVDIHGTLLRSASVDDQGESAPLPEGVTEWCANCDPLVEVGQRDDREMHGLIALEGGVFAVASRPILNNDSKGPSRGTILFGQRIEGPTLEALAQRLRMQIAVRDVTSGELSPELRADLDALRRSEQPLVAPLNDETIRGATVMKDVHGTPRFLVQVAVPRFVWKQAGATTSLLLGTLCVVGLAAVGITILVLRIVVLRRLAALHGALAGIGDSGDLARRVPVEGSDELADFSATVNSLLQRVARSQEELAAKANALARTGEELKAARDAAETASRSKSEFLANMSHEVRTPMTAILGFADLLAEHIDLPGFRPAECIETIRNNARHLLTIINDILDLSKIEAGRMLIERTGCVPGVLANEVVELMRENAARKGIELQVRFVTPVPSIVMSDPTRLRQMLLNLVGNAIKFTKDGSVALCFSCERAARRLVIDVVDTGIGIRPEQAKRLFSSFSQADSSTSRVYGGTGLGLAISKRLAQLLGGDLELRATSPAGSTFRLFVDTGSLEQVDFVDDPLSGALCPLDPRALGALVPGTGPLQGIHILFAEDGPDNQRLIGFHLRKAGALVDVVGDGRAAVDACARAASAATPYDLVLMDMQMPVLDGYGAAREIRTRGLTLPILALTAHAMEGDRNQCLAAGCDEYETKPIDRASLIATCERLVAHASRRAPNREAA